MHPGAVPWPTTSWTSSRRARQRRAGRTSSGPASARKRRACRRVAPGYAAALEHRQPGAPSWRTGPVCTSRGVQRRMPASDGDLPAGAVHLSAVAMVGHVVDVFAAGVPAVGRSSRASTPPPSSAHRSRESGQRLSRSTATSATAARGTAAAGRTSEQWRPTNASASGRAGSLLATQPRPSGRVADAHVTGVSWPDGIPPTDGTGAARWGWGQEASGSGGGVWMARTASMVSASSGRLSSR